MKSGASFKYAKFISETPLRKNPHLLYHQSWIASTIFGFSSSSHAKKTGKDAADVVDVAAAASACLLIIDFRNEKLLHVGMRLLLVGCTNILQHLKPFQLCVLTTHNIMASVNCRDIRASFNDGLSGDASSRCVP